MAYTDYLPSKACLLAPEYSAVSITIGDAPTTRYYSTGGSFISLTDFEESYNSTTVYWRDVTDPTEEYCEDVYEETGNATYTTGAYVKVSNIGLKFRYTGDIPLEITSISEANTYHPCAKNALDNFTNSEIWLCVGTTAEKNIVNGCMNSSYTSSAVAYEHRYLRLSFLANLAELDNTWGMVDGIGIYLGGMKNVASVDVSLDLGADSFTVDTRYKESLFISVTNFELITITLTPFIDGYNKRYDTTISTVVCGPYIELGSSLLGHTSSRVSTHAVVLSDGLEKTITERSYDTFSGAVEVLAADLQKVEFNLARATSGDYVFYTGTSTEIYDQRVYLGRLEYDSPIRNNAGIYDINISGQTQSYSVENPYVQFDSTNGAPV